MPSVVGQNQGQNSVQVLELLRSTPPCAVGCTIHATSHTGTLSVPTFPAHSHYRMDTVSKLLRHLFPPHQGGYGHKRPNPIPKNQGKACLILGFAPTRARVGGFFFLNWLLHTTMFVLPLNVSTFDGACTLAPYFMPSPLLQVLLGPKPATRHPSTLPGCLGVHGEGQNAPSSLGPPITTSNLGSRVVVKPFRGATS